MDSLITAAARALEAGDFLGVLKRVGLRDDPPALALRGIVMAQLGDFERAKDLLQLASRAFGPKESVARARCIVAEAEIALVTRDLGWRPHALDAARAVLDAHGDRLNAAHARHLEIRRLLLIGRLDEAERLLAQLDPAPFPPASRAAYELVLAEIAMRRIRALAARGALARAGEAAQQSGNPALIAEVDIAVRTFNSPAARLMMGGEERLLGIDEVEDILRSEVLVVDACRRCVRGAERVVSLARRPVLFALVRALGEAWPGDLSRDELVRRVFRARHADESHRARLRVEVGRLRTELRSFTAVNATAEGFRLSPHHAAGIAVLAPPVEGENAALIALLADGQAWSSSALALALGASTRTVQRRLEPLAAAGQVRSYGRGPVQRWMAASLPGFTTALLLPGPLPSD
jgi:hypothetical protein